ncbi:chromosome partitioning protein ParB [Sorangium sp. So ce1151]|uniref:chromosome partitioning protein ParB n=1 Tax=Sorangium sp. So ce1151 TaxID=3133332 RepID=UPI003F63B8A9
MAAKRTAKPRTPREPKAAPAAPAPRARRKKAAPAAGTRGLGAAELAAGAPPPEVAALGDAIRSDGGSVLAIYREPVGGAWAILAGLPLDRVEPTPFQRDLSEAHVARLGEVIDKIDCFLDPIIAVRTPLSSGPGRAAPAAPGEGRYWTPNGNHRRAALTRLGAKSAVALVLPDERIAYRILALNTEKAHNIREKALEVTRMARSLADLDPRPEHEFRLEFEEPSLLTLGLCYERRPRFSGGAYQSVLRHIDRFLDEPLPEAIETRKARAELLLALDDAVAQAVDGLRARGFESPYLKAFVVARINPLRFQRSPDAPFEPTLDKMLAAAQRFDPASVRPDQVARAAGPPEEPAG